MARLLTCIALLAAFLLCPAAPSFAVDDLPAIKARGVLKHLGIPYANFITGQGDGLDVDILKEFCASIGVAYEYVQEDWDTALPGLIGHTFTVKNGNVEFTGDVPVRGDLLANGLTVLAWRKQVITYSTPTFPTQVWLVVRADSPITPITPTGDITRDIALTREKIKGRGVLCKSGTCLDPALFDLPPAGATARNFAGTLNDLAPAVIMGDAESTLLDVPDALVALQKFPGRIKIVGPMTGKQEMAVGFRKDQPLLCAAFDAFFATLRASGRYDTLVRRYYPLAYEYYPEFFKQ